MVILDKLKEVYLKYGDKPAFYEDFVFANERTTFKELYWQSFSLAEYLYSQGIRKGMYVTVLVGMSANLYKTLIALWIIGAIPVFFDISATTDTIKKCTNIVKPHYVLGAPRTILYAHAKRLFSGIPKIDITKYNPLKRVVNMHYENDIEDQGAIITFTSGTSGTPKAIVRTHDFLLKQYDTIKNNCGYNPNEIDLGILPIFTLANLATGITTVIPNSQLRNMSKINAKNLVDQIRRYNINSLTVSPNVLNQILNYASDNNISLSSLKTLHIGGGPVFPGMLKKLDDMDVQPMIVYGSSEAEPIATLSWQEMKENIDKIKQGQGLPVGHIIPEIKLKIIKNDIAFPDKTIQKHIFEQETDIGEILVSGKNVLKGYLNGVGDSGNKINDNGTVWHRTGDCGYVDQDGMLWLLGRKDNFITTPYGIAYTFPIQCVCDTKYDIHTSAFVEINKTKLLVFEEKDAEKAKQIEKSFLETHFYPKIILVKKIPMDKRHNAKIDLMKLITLYEDGKFRSLNIEERG